MVSQQGSYCTLLRTSLESSSGLLYHEVSTNNSNNEFCEYTIVLDDIEKIVTKELNELLPQRKENSV